MQSRRNKICYTDDDGSGQRVYYDTANTGEWCSGAVVYDMIGFLGFSLYLEILSFRLGLLQLETTIMYRSEYRIYVSYVVVILKVFHILRINSIRVGGVGLVWRYNSTFCLN